MTADTTHRVLTRLKRQYEHTPTHAVYHALAGACFTAGFFIGVLGLVLALESTAELVLGNPTRTVALRWGTGVATVLFGSLMLQRATGWLSDGENG